MQEILLQRKDSQRLHKTWNKFSTSIPRGNTELKEVSEEAELVCLLSDPLCSLFDCFKHTESRSCNTVWPFMLFEAFISRVDEKTEYSPFSKF